VRKEILWKSGKDLFVEAIFLPREDGWIAAVPHWTLDHQSTQSGKTCK